MTIGEATKIVDVLDQVLSAAAGMRAVQCVAMHTPDSGEDTWMVHIFDWQTGSGILTVHSATVEEG